MPYWFPSVTVELEVKPVPVIVKVCAEVDPVTGFGLTPLMCGAAAGACTENEYWFDDWLPSITCTHQLAAVVPNVGLITNCVALRDEIAMFP